jgi:cytosine/adenosine deaminase-related metal-dependent hydrolase
LRALDMAHRAGVDIAYGTDLLGAMHVYQNREFKIRAEVQPAASIICAATVTAARLLRLEGKIGAIQEGAFADLLVLDGNPLEDINVLAEPDRHLQFIMKQGRVYRDRLETKRPMKSLLLSEKLFPGMWAEWARKRRQHGDAPCPRPHRCIPPTVGWAL